MSARNILVFAAAILVACIGSVCTTEWLDLSGGPAFAAGLVWGGVCGQIGLRFTRWG